jgi:ABC-type multidrug transport system ATPase subunit
MKLKSKIPQHSISAFKDLTLRDDMESFRKLSGICPQQNILFEKLTVYEHLEVYAHFKSVSKGEINNKVLTQLIYKSFN